MKNLLSSLTASEIRDLNALHCIRVLYKKETGIPEEEVLNAASVRHFTPEDINHLVDQKRRGFPLFRKTYLVSSSKSEAFYNRRENELETQLKMLAKKKRLRTQIRKRNDVPLLLLKRKIFEGVFDDEPLGFFNPDTSDSRLQHLLAIEDGENPWVDLLFLVLLDSYLDGPEPEEDPEYTEEPVEPVEEIHEPEPVEEIHEPIIEPEPIHREPEPTYEEPEPEPTYEEPDRHSSFGGSSDSYSSYDSGGSSYDSGSDSGGYDSGGSDD